MGLIKPSLPDLDYDQWRSQPRREQVRAMVVHWAEHGFDASGATSRAERRTTPVNLRHQPARPSEDRTVGWSQRRACYLTTEVKGTTISIRQLNWHFAARSVDIR